MEQILDSNKMQALRAAGTISQSEVVKYVGDIYFAEDVLTGARRQLSSSVIGEVKSSNRRLLKD